MKQKIILLCLAGLGLETSFAQTTIKPAIGLNFTDFSMNDNGTSSGKAGWQIGGTVAFGKKFYFEPGIFYTEKSTQVTESGQVNPDEFKAQIKGVRVPVGIGLNLLGNEKTVLSLRGFGGASGFFITSVSDELNEGDINKTSWGVYAGAGIDVWKLFVDFSYEWSLTNVTKDIADIDVGKSRSLFLNAGLRINL